MCAPKNPSRKQRALLLGARSTYQNQVPPMPLALQATHSGHRGSPDTSKRAGNSLRLSPLQTVLSDFISRCSPQAPGLLASTCCPKPSTELVHSHTERPCPLATFAPQELVERMWSFSPAEKLPSPWPLREKSTLHVEATVVSIHELASFF